MRRQAIAFGVLCAIGGSTWAQSTVRIYGRLDASVQMLKRGGTISYALNDGVGATSNIGFAGNEDLGSGLQAVWNLESKILQDTGAAGAPSSSGTTVTAPSGFWSRNAYVGLKGGFGTLVAGRMYTPAVSALYNMNAIRTGINTGLAGNVAAQGIGNDFWNNNILRYDSPAFGPLSVAISYSFGELAASSQGRNVGAAVTYRDKGWVVNAGIQRDGDIAPTGNAVTWTVFTASYTLSAWKIAAGYDRVRNGSRIAGWTDSRLWTTGLAFNPLEALTLSAQYFNNRENVTHTTSRQVVLNAHYFLSKRTAIYAMATHTDNAALTVQPLYVTAGTRHAKATGLATGVLHTF